MEPVVYHGYTLTTKILFKDVITTVEQHAFEVRSVVHDIYVLGRCPGHPTLINNSMSDSNA